jgi:NADPH2:quinone reductase
MEAIPRTMKAAVIDQHGGPEVLRIDERPVPRPGPTELLVEVHASSVNPVDAKIRAASGARRTFPLILGYDASGVVVEVGEGVKGFRPGDAVFGCPNLMAQGAHAEFALLDHRAAAAPPARIGHRDAGALPLVGLTAWEALHERARIEPGQTVLIHGGAGGVGHIAVQLARLHGCRVVTTAGRPESIAFCRDVLGADEVIDYVKEDVVARVKELSQGRGLPVVMDTVGGKVFERSVACVAPGGQLVTILGATPSEAAATTLLFSSITVHYEFMGARLAYGLAPERQGHILRGLAALVDRGWVNVHVSQRFPLSDLAKAHRQIETGHTLGKIGIDIAAHSAS